MMRFTVAALLTAAFVSGFAGFVSADSPETASESYPVVAQLVMRDRTVTITSAPEGYLYSIADEAGNLSASLTESQMAEQYPEILDALRPAVAGEGSTLMMLAPMMN
ncbi:MAG: hypothetical protein ACFBSF_09140 [Leptolyngbyaceae cyanobacterium]